MIDESRCFGMGCVSKGTAGSSWIKTLICAAAIACFSITPAFAQCTLNGNPSNCTLNGPLTIDTYSDAASTTTTANGTLTLASPGTMSIQSFFQQNGDVTLNGTGTLTLSGAQIGTDSNGRTLNNGIVIAGSGLIGSNAGPVFQNLSLNNSGTIDANVSSALTIGGTGGSFTNSGVFEATAGGTLNLQTPQPINNSGGNVTASGSGSVVNVSSSIQGGTLNTSSSGVLQTSGTATLDGATQGTITLSDGSTYTAGAATTTNVTGTLALGSVTGSTLALTGNLRLVGTEVINGPGVVTMTGGQIGTDGNGRTLTNQTGTTIQGTGTIGSNAGTVTQNLSFTNNGTVNANASGTLTVGGNGGTIINSGTMEATAGGTLSLATTAAIQNFGTISSTGTGSTVNVGTTIVGGSLTTSGTSVMQTSGSATLDAADLGAITLTDGSTYTAGASTTTSLTGTLNLGTTTGSTLALAGNLRLTGTGTLSGPGSVTMTGGQIGTDGNGRTLNVSSGTTIQGSGTVGSNVGTVSQNMNLVNSGTIDGNVSGSGNSLTIGGNGTVITNTGTFEATAGGTLNLSTAAAIGNNGGNITASGAGSTVNVSTTIQGGTLNTSGGGVMQTVTAATLDGSTHAITISDGSTYTAASGLTTILGTLNLGTSTGGTLALSGQLRLQGTTTFMGPGSVTMSGNGQIGTDGNGRTLINQSLIQGSGVIGSNIGSLTSNLTMSNSGTVNANSSGNTLTIQGTGGTTNTGVLEATSGGILSLTSGVNNNGGNITASGAGSTVDITRPIEGGTLNTSSGGVMQTVTAATLDGSSLGAITISDGSTYTAGAGTVTSVLGTLNLGTSTGGTLALGGDMQLVRTETLSGPGSLTMTAGSQIGTDGNGRTLINNALIQGAGVIGSSTNPLSNNLALNNTGTVNANSSGNTLTIAGTNGTTNTGILKATGGGILSLTAGVNNNGGNITATGTGSTVSVNTSIQGGTLNTSGGGLMQTVTAATLDGSSQGAITISDGSTYTAGSGTVTTVLGTLNLGTSTGSTLALGGQMKLVGTETLAGPGSLTMTAGSQIGTDGNGRTLINQATIQGTGLIGSNTSPLSNNLNVTNSGTLLANVSGTTLTLAGTGTLTNTGTMQADAGSKLFSSMSGLSSSTYSGGTLLTGTYNVYGTSTSAGTIKISALGTSGGEIVNNAATIMLNGVDSNFLDGGGFDALSNLASNSGSFSVLNGRDINTPGAFTNTGTVNIGATSEFDVNGGESEYLQTAGTTMVDGTLTPGSTVILGGLLEGVGTVNNSVTVNGGTVAPGDPPGTLTINGLFDLENGDLLIGLAGIGLYDALNVNGTAELGGTLEFDLQDGFNVAGGETFFIADDSSRSGTFNTVDFSGLHLGAGLTAQIKYDQGANDNEVELLINGTTTATPEPSTWLMFAGGLAALGAFQMARRRRKCA
jgi:fibronectin-binding autotransporter adhesin